MPTPIPAISIRCCSISRAAIVSHAKALRARGPDGSRFRRPSQVHITGNPNQTSPNVDTRERYCKLLASRNGDTRMMVWAERTVEVAGTTVHLTRGGKGPPVVVLHRDIGMPATSLFQNELAKSSDVIVPNHPGWQGSRRAEWMRSVRDLAVMYRGLLAELKIQNAVLIGLGFGGWIAAEMATMAPVDVAKLVLVAPM